MPTVPAGGATVVVGIVVTTGGVAGGASSWQPAINIPTNNAPTVTEAKRPVPIKRVCMLISPSPACTLPLSLRNVARYQIESKARIVSLVTGAAGGRAQFALSLKLAVAGRAGIDVLSTAANERRGSKSPGDAQTIRKFPEIGAVIGVNDMGDFMAKRVQCFFRAMLSVCLPAYDNAVALWLVITAKGFASGNDDLRHRQSPFKMRFIEPNKLRL